MEILIIVARFSSFGFNEIKKVESSRLLHASTLFYLGNQFIFLYRIAGKLIFGSIVADQIKNSLLLPNHEMMVVIGISIGNAADKNNYHVTLY